MACGCRVTSADHAQAPCLVVQCTALPKDSTVEWQVIGTLANEPTEGAAAIAGPALTFLEEAFEDELHWTLRRSGRLVLAVGFPSASASPSTDSVQLAKLRDRLGSIVQARLFVTTAAAAEAGLLYSALAHLAPTTVLQVDSVSSLQLGSTQYACICIGRA